MAASDSLAPYILKRVEELKEEIHEDHSGSYGFVYKVKVDGFLRIAKKPHPIFLTRVTRDEKVRVVANFKKECNLLSKLRHPNIVQFIGVYYGNGGKDEIALVMEKVEYELAKFLLEKSQVHLSTKLSILHDVTYGLVYLHENNPPIIHRDLTARNVLLTSSYQAKIADVGVAKLMDKAAMEALSHTKAPGQMFYMPPEACMEKALCTSKLDIFSFGHLSLHTLLGDYPEVYEINITPEMLQQRTMQRMKRKKSLDRVGSDHCLYPLITRCLLDHPNMRPTTREINSSIGRLVEAHCSVEPPAADKHGDHEPKFQGRSRDVEKELSECMEEVEVRNSHIAHLVSSNKELSDTLQQRNQLIIAYQNQANAIERRNRELESKVRELESKLSHFKSTPGGKRKINKSSGGPTEHPPSPLGIMSAAPESGATMASCANTSPPGARRPLSLLAQLEHVPHAEDRVGSQELMQVDSPPPPPVSPTLQNRFTTLIKAQQFEISQLETKFIEPRIINTSSYVFHSGLPKRMVELFLLDDLALNSNDDTIKFLAKKEFIRNFNAVTEIELMQTDSRGDALMQMLKQSYEIFLSMCWCFVTAIKCAKETSFPKSLLLCLKVFQQHKSIVESRSPTLSLRPAHLFLLRRLRSKSLQEVSSMAYRKFESSSIQEGIQIAVALVVPTMNQIAGGVVGMKGAEEREAATEEVGVVEKVREEWCQCLNRPQLTEAEQDRLGDLLTSLLDDGNCKTFNLPSDDSLPEVDAVSLTSEFSSLVGQLPQLLGTVSL